ncbi:MAG TPA: hypothetical protein VFR81_22505 [Longimicrobium sp.]|nr:hypothetical protein [Longimicrobium sp.]
MADTDPTSIQHLEAARELVWEAVQKLEEAQRVLFRAGDTYVSEVWGDGVRAVIEVTERMADLCGDLSSVEMEINRVGRRDKARGT